MLAEPERVVPLTYGVEVRPRDEQAHHLRLARAGSELTAELSPRIALRLERWYASDFVKLLGAPDASHFVQVNKRLDEMSLVWPVLEIVSVRQAAH